MIPLMAVLGVASKVMGDGKGKGKEQKPSIMFNSFGAEEASDQADKAVADAQEADATRRRRLALLRGSTG
jgi:hypothetical protein